MYCKQKIINLQSKNILQEFQFVSPDGDFGNTENSFIVFRVNRFAFNYLFTTEKVSL